MPKDCLFAKYFGEIPSTEVYRDEEIFAFEDIIPLPLHILVIPVKHIQDISSQPLKTEKLWAIVAGRKSDRGR